YFSNNPPAIGKGKRGREFPPLGLFFSALNWLRGGQQWAGAEHARAAKRTLVVEDNLDNRRILVYRLKRIGEFEIVEASNGEEALAIVQTAPPPDLIFMDLKMPVMDGWEATKRIRQLEFGRDIPIIALT